MTETLQEPTASEIGTLDVQLIKNHVPSAKSAKRQPQYHKCSKNERYNIGKYAVKNGNINAFSKFKTAFPKLSKSSVRTFKKKNITKS